MSLRRLSAAMPVNGAYTSPGSMHHRISFYQQAPRNDDGSFPNDVLFIESWCAFRILQGRELERAQEVVTDVEAMIIVPYIDGLSQAMTAVRYDGERYQILYVADPDGRQVEQRCYCRLIGQVQQ